MIGVIVNPNAKKNKRRPRHLEVLEEIVGDRGIVVRTQRVEDIPEALDQFRDAGCRYWMADGGDGALHWMLNEALARYGERYVTEDVVFVPANGGTIDFVAKAIGLSGRSDAILRRLVGDIDAGREPRVVEVPAVAMPGTRRTEEGDVPFHRVGFGNAFAGYGANFYGPFYESDAGRGPLRIVAMMGAAFAAAFGGAVLRGPLERFKPQFVAQAEYDFLRPLLADAEVDGEPFRDGTGDPMHAFTVIQCASIPLHLGGVLRVFNEATPGHMHLQIGHVTPFEMAKIMPGLVTGKNVGHQTPNAFDGTATHLRVRCHEGQHMTPILDGEVYDDLVEVDVQPGPTFRMAIPTDERRRLLR